MRGYKLGSKLYVTKHVYTMGCTYNVEDGCKGTSNIVEGHTQVLEREVIEDHHADKHY